MNKEQRQLHAYDAGLLGGYGGESVGWWHDYIRAELARAHDHYAGQHSALLDALDAAEDLGKRGQYKATPEHTWAQWAAEWKSDAAKAESRATAAEARVALLEGLLREAGDVVGVFTRHHEPWMDDFRDDVEVSTYARHTFGQLRAARALAAKLEGRGDA
jgi:hypothetical protein